MRIRRSLAVAAATLASSVSLLASLSVPAEAVTVDFSFSNDPFFYGNVPGTVTGQIVGLTDNATSAASAIYVDSYPAALGSYSTPFNVMAWTGYYMGENSFTLSGGQVTGAAFSLYGANGINDQLYINSGCCGGAGTNFLDIGSYDQLYVWNDNGIGPGGVTFSSSVSAVPIPAALPLFASAVVALAAWGRRRRATAAS